MQESKISEREVRIQKIARLKEFWIIPFVQRFDKQVMIGDIVWRFWKILWLDNPFRVIDQILDWHVWTKDTQSSAREQHIVQTAWRLMLFRSHGWLSFGKLMDESDDIQLMFHKDHCLINRVVNDSIVEQVDHVNDWKGETLTAYKLMEKLVDVGDFLWISWELFYTHKWELTIFVSSFTFLTKAIRPLGDKFHGIAGQEANYRQRYLDMIHHRSSLEKMKMRSQFIKVLREFYRSEWFIELDTPILWTSASGAAAKPFVTHHNDFDIDMYFRIAPEISLKMATVGWLEKVFEIGKNFRNEWSSPSHHQEFLVAEHYAVYWNYVDNMNFMEKMFKYLFAHVEGLKKKVIVADKDGVEREVDFSIPWQRIDFIDLMKKDSSIDIAQFSADDENELRWLIKSLGFIREWIDIQTTATMIDYLYKKVSRPKILWPAFIYNYPKSMQPLARTSDEDNHIVEQFQLVVNGWEICKAYGELVDPLELQQNFDAQCLALERWDDDATSWDDDFVLAMEYGMPLQSGRWMGIDRIFAMLIEQKNIRDVIMFPLMKPLVCEKWLVNDTTWDDNEEGCCDDWKEEWSLLDISGDRIVHDCYPSLEKAQSLAKKYLVDTHRHCLEVACVMKWFAKRLWKSDSEQNQWFMTGLLHDVDRDYINKDMHTHLWDEFLRIMSEIDAPDALILDIRSHYIEKDYTPVDSELRKYLVSVDELSGFLYAYSLMRPEWYKDMQWKSINKKLKDKAFAAWVNRDHVRYCEKFLQRELSEFALEVAQALYETQSGRLIE